VKISGHQGRCNIQVTDSIAWIRPRNQMKFDIVDTVLCQVCLVWTTSDEVCDECLAAYGNEQE
jgi:hypothetical protein